MSEDSSVNGPEELHEIELQDESDAPILGRPADDAERPALDYQVVGIGSSAVGLKALNDLLTTLPSDTGMSFVLIPHLSAGQQGILLEILSRHTKAADQLDTAWGAARGEPDLYA